MSAASTAGFWKRNQKTIAPWLFLAPSMIMFMLYVIIPIFQSVWISFHEWDGLGPKTYAGMQNYADLFDDKSFWTSLKNNIIWLMLYLLAVPAGLAVALFLNQTVSGIRLYKSLFFFPLRHQPGCGRLDLFVVLRTGFRFALHVDPEGHWF